MKGDGRGIWIVPRGLVANARGMQTFTFRAFRAVTLYKPYKLRKDMASCLGPAGWTGLGSPKPGLAVGKPSRALTTA